MTGEQMLHPTTVRATWIVCGFAMAWANYKSITEASRRAGSKRPKASPIFYMTFLAYEQLAYAKRIPFPLLVLACCCVLAILFPGA